ncbi:M23 family metallopeptidase [Motiliproteus sp.]|uniref:M23 family metallopeptidase n=1 Tax=Motiliproteus sp. TaxID=1898955 RepID=UPI003BA8CE04
MRKRLLITLTTARGSRQLSLNLVARCLLLLFVLMLLASFFISNALLVKTSDELHSLTADYQKLGSLYTGVLGSHETVQTELDKLSLNLTSLEQERNSLQQVNEAWSQPLRQLELAMGLEPAETMTIERSQQLQQMANERLFMLHGIPNGYPVKMKRLTDGFGMRKHPLTGQRKHHNGVDFPVDTGTPIYATADGAVEYAGYHKKSGFGYLVIINHNFGFKSYYAHMKKRPKVRSGQLVRKGELIGQSGNSGKSTGPHLHYEVRYLFKPLNPVPFLNWSLHNYDQIMTQEKAVAWDGLKKMQPLNQLALPSLSSPEDISSADK